MRGKHSGMTSGLWLGEKSAECGGNVRSFYGACWVWGTCRAFKKSSGGRLHADLEPKRKVRTGNKDGRLLDSCRSAQCVNQRQRDRESTGRMGFWVSGDQYSWEKGRVRVGTVRHQGEDRHQKEGPLTEMSRNWGKTLDLTRTRVLLTLTWEVSGEDEVKARRVPLMSQHMKQLGPLLDA